MTQVTTTEAQELKDAIASLAKIAEANSKAIEANNKAIADLVATISSLRQEIRIGFANVDTKIAEVKGELKVLGERQKTSEAKLEGKIDKIEERMNSQNFRIDNFELLKRGVATTAVGGLLLAFAKILFGLGN